jgi:hypothetical protein
MTTHKRSWPRRWKIGATSVAAGVTLLLSLFTFSLLARPIDARQTCDFTVEAGDETGLINAINSANANADSSTICLTNSTYTFTSGPYTTWGATALPTLNSPITIIGNGAIIERQSASVFRLLHTGAGSPNVIELRDLTLRGGDTASSIDWHGRGGAILSQSEHLTLINVTLTSNHSATDGGAIAGAGGDLVLQNCTVDGNRAEMRGGGVFVGSGYLTVDHSLIGGSTGNEAAMGGGIAVVPGHPVLHFVVTISETTISRNRAVSTAWSSATYGGGIALSENTINGIVFDSVDLTLSDGTAVLDNVSQNGSGGGMYASMETEVGGGATIDFKNGVRFASNTAALDGGGLWINSRDVWPILHNGVEFSRNVAQAGRGGGLWINSAPFEITDEVLFEFNRSGSYGGAVFVGDGANGTFTNVNFSFNQSGQGGALSQFHAVFESTIRYSCLVGNGTAIYFDPASPVELRAYSNWWGAASGPSGNGSGAGDGVRGKVGYDPFLIGPAPMCGGGPPSLVLPTFTPSPTKHPSLTPLPTFTPSHTPPQPTATPTLFPLCSDLSLQGAQLVGNRLQLLIRNNAAVFFISGANVNWHKTARYPDMFADTMALGSQPRFWQGPDYTDNTQVDSTTLGWNQADLPYTARQIAPYGMVTTYQIAFANGPLVLDDYYSVGDFNGTTLYFSREWGGTGADCSLTLSGLPTSTPPAVPPSATPLPVCSNYEFTFESFEPNGVLHFSITNTGPVVDYITHFRLNWLHTPDAGPLDFVSVGGASAFDPAGIKLWDGGDNDPPALSSATWGDPGWLVNVAIEPGQTRDVWFDFDATTGRLDTALGYTAGDFNGSLMRLGYDCGSVFVDPAGPTLTPSPTMTPFTTITPVPTFTLPANLTVMPGCGPVGSSGTVLCASQ